MADTDNREEHRSVMREWGHKPAAASPPVVGSDYRQARDRQIVRASIVGIVANVVLAAAKLVVGLFTQSIAFLLDAVNSLTDVFSSVVTIIGAKLASMRPSRSHPYGYGRVEYVTSIVIAAIILAAGVVSLRESVVKIIHPSEPDYTAVALLVMAVTAGVKVVVGVYFKRKGAAINAQPITASGVDALYDALLTAGTVASGLFCLVSHVDIDGWVGAVVSLFIIKAGLGVLRDAISTIIGERPDPALVHGIKTCVNDHEGVMGVYDLFLDSFGPNNYMASLNIAVPDDYTAHQIHDLCRHITEEVRDCYCCTLTVGIYAANSTGDYVPIREKLMAEVAKHPEVVQVHGFYVDSDSRTVDFDIVVDFHCDAEPVRAAIVGAMKEAYPHYNFTVVLDSDFIE
ncbi:cation diffusion facilitator family transporter [Eggerthellaceae bacterium zg-887]|uniref:cation diffusion facilitator family transporter n=1 Tax=Xiamenia xianingshaonis TaxID=2682776 RepID=UPI0013EC5274|nr:cation diffusion facilitator family transporter [Xiamenia xianingshaonis]NGM17569.1 cation diffusion facilitator family transporter [Eggerthellaceae bacterium zg-893]NHM15390.1 cation diffusion facilitator family transporter [Xiamenia xianingshaonis]